MRNPWKVDDLSFSEMYSSKLEGLSSEGIAVDLSIQWTGNGSIKLTIKNLVAKIHDICDLSGELYDRIVNIVDKSVYFDESLPVSYDEDKVYDEIFPFSNEHETIDIENFLIQCIQVEKPFVSIKPGKEYILDEFESSEEESFVI